MLLATGVVYDMNSQNAVLVPTADDALRQEHMGAQIVLHGNHSIMHAAKDLTGAHRWSSLRSQHLRPAYCKRMYNPSLLDEVSRIDG